MAYLERYSDHPAKAARQGVDLFKLIHAEQEWLEAWRPDQLVPRYNDPLHALRAVRRIATHEGLEAYVARERRHEAAKGIVTIIGNVQVIHPVLGMVSGDDVDYWLAADASHELHNDVAASAVYASAKPHLEKQADKPSEGWQYVMATIEIDHPHPPIGFTNPDKADLVPRLEPIGEPAVLSLPEGQEDDPLGLLKGGKVLQLYYGEGLVQENVALDS